MTCPQCGSDTAVIDSRPHGNLNMVRRRRRCPECRYRFTTYEVGEWLVRTNRPAPLQLLKQKRRKQAA